MAEIALRIERSARIGDMVRIKPIKSRGSYRVNEIAWSEKVHRVVSAKSGEMGARFGICSVRKRKSNASRSNALRAPSGQSLPALI